MSRAFGPNQLVSASSVQQSRVHDGFYSFPYTDREINSINKARNCRDGYGYCQIKPQGLGVAVETVDSGILMRGNNFLRDDKDRMVIELPAVASQQDSPIADRLREQMSYFQLAKDQFEEAARYPVKILFPYKLGWHWNVGEIIIEKAATGSLSVTCGKYDPNGTYGPIEDGMRTDIDAYFRAQGVTPRFDVVTQSIKKVQTGVACGLYAAIAMHNLKTKAIGSVWDGVFTDAERGAESRAMSPQMINLFSIVRDFRLRDDDRGLIESCNSDALEHFCRPMNEREFVLTQRAAGELLTSEEVRTLDELVSKAATLGAESLNKLRHSLLVGSEADKLGNDYSHAQIVQFLREDLQDRAAKSIIFREGDVELALPIELFQALFDRLSERDATTSAPPSGPSPVQTEVVSPSMQLAAVSDVVVSQGGPQKAATSNHADKPSLTAESFFPSGLLRYSEVMERGIIPNADYAFNDQDSFDLTHKGKEMIFFRPEECAFNSSALSIISTVSSELDQDSSDRKGVLTRSSVSDITKGSLDHDSSSDQKDSLVASPLSEITRVNLERDLELSARLSTAIDEGKININARSEGGMTLLHLAARCGFAKTGTMLIEKGADPAIGPANVVKWSDRDAVTIPIHAFFLKRDKFTLYKEQYEEFGRALVVYTDSKLSPVAKSSKPGSDYEDLEKVSDNSQAREIILKNLREAARRAGISKGEAGLFIIIAIKNDGIARKLPELSKDLERANPEFNSKYIERLAIRAQNFSGFFQEEMLKSKRLKSLDPNYALEMFKESKAEGWDSFKDAQDAFDQTCKRLETSLEVLRGKIKKVPSSAPGRPLTGSAVDKESRGLSISEL